MSADMRAPRKEPIAKWLDEVRTLFDARMLRKYSKTDQPPVMHVS